MGIMCKLFGAICVLGATGYFAVNMNQVLEQRKRELRKLYSILLQLKSEIQYMCNPLPESFLKMTVPENGVFSQWMTYVCQQLEEKEEITFSVVWRESLSYLQTYSALEAEDVEPLGELADKLGTGDVSSQLKAIDYALLHIERNRKTLEDQINQKKKVTVTLSLFCGVMTLICLL
ncbi:MAG: stage III sporulation protein AB [Lachnospiraceae bacterium]|nr:stage III sporulation protein AB [Lachnospiraceae bacterium]